MIRDISIFLGTDVQERPDRIKENYTGYKSFKINKKKLNTVKLF